MIAILTGRWQRLATRERKLMLLCAVVLLVPTVQYGLLQPLHGWQQRQQQSLQRAERDLRAMQQRQPRLASLLKQQPLPLPTPLTAFLTGSAAENSVAVQAEGSELNLSPQPLTPVLKWLAGLEQRYALQPAHLVLKAEANGKVSGTLRFNHAD